jgi:hypothetical protein
LSRVLVLSEELSHMKGVVHFSDPIDEALANRCVADAVDEGTDNLEELRI